MATEAAAELRRRIGNRRQAALAAGADDHAETSSSSFSTSGSRRNAVSSDILPALVESKHELYEIQNEVFASDAKQVAAIRCADQQLTVEKNLRRLKSDIQASQSSVRLKSDRLDELQMRVRHLTQLSRDTALDKTFARTTVAAQASLRAAKLAARKCSHCNRSFMEPLYTSHVANCSGRRVITLPEISASHPLPSPNQENDHRAEIGVPGGTSPPRFLSQAPRNFRVASAGITHNTIAFEWDPPIFTGSHPIIDYELRYSICSSMPQRNDPSARLLESLPPLRLSYWCQTRPVPANRFVLTALTANQEYRNISIAAVTRNGVSPISNSLDIVKTAPPVPPSPPLFLTVGAVTAKTINLSWTPPSDDGGVPVQDYEISFVEAVMEETVTFDKNFLDVSEIVYKPRLIRTFSAETVFTLLDLLSGKAHKEFRVRAVNKAGIPGVFSQSIETIITIAPGSEHRLLDELQAAVNARTRIVDSQFLSGFMQRYERQHYIELVSQFIVETHPHLKSKVDALLLREERATSEHGGEEGSIQHLAKSTMKFDHLSEEQQIAERHRQFHFRIADIQQELKRVEYNVQWCKDRRTDLVSLIRAAENRITEKQAELERARTFRGPQLDSDVLENGLQRFYTEDLVVALEDEIEIEQLYILDTKADIVKTENYLRADEKRLSVLRQRLHDRMDALARFESDPDAFSKEAKDGRYAAMARIHDGLIYRSFSALVYNRDECKDRRRKMTTALRRMCTCKLRSALYHWRRVVRTHPDGDSVYGAGSMGLLNASIGREEVAFEARTALLQIRQTESQLKSLDCSASQETNNEDFASEMFVNEKFYPFCLEADARIDVKDYEGAFRLYQLIESHEQWVDRMDLHQVCELQHRIGLVLFRLGQNEQALVRFHRALVIAGRPGGGANKREEGKALLWIARVHFALGDLRQSIDNFERALLCFEVVGDSKGQLSCYRGLERAFAKLEDGEMQSHNRVLADEIEFVLEKKIHNANSRLQNLQTHLVGIGAESSKEIELERVKAIVPRLRRERIKCKYRAREESKWVASLEELLREKKAMLEQGEADLKRALASDSTQVDSAVIRGTSARYEIEDFKRKLAKLMGIIKVAEDHITKEIMNSNVRVRNADDEIKELESELLVETGALMRRMLSKEPIRCFSFNATNEALKNVIGTASHGIMTCVACSGLNGLLFDLLSGACLSQAVGDPQKDHLGAPVGHQAPIVSLFYIGARIYSGSMDASVGVWDVKDEYIGGSSIILNRFLTDFDSTVVSIHADAHWLACGSSDCDVFLFDTITLVLLARVISAHNRTTTALFVESFKNTFTTGGADHRVKVWEIGAAASSSARRRVKLLHVLEAQRRGDDFFNGHLHPVSSVRQIASEIVSADTGGRIIIWNLEATESKLLRICDTHKCSVTCLQFDAMKVVSGGADGKICVTDFATGHLVQTLVGHDGCILDLQFDRKRLVSMSADGKLRLWYWQTRIGIGADRKKHHILGAGETLKSLSLKYRTSIDKLLQWNNLPDSTKLYLGQKLVVEIDTDGAASDELLALDMGVSTQLGKLAYENLDFLSANRAKTEDVEEQWAAQKLAQLAREYFPPTLEEESSPANDAEEEGEQDEVDSDDDSVMAVDSVQEEGVDDEQRSSVSGDDERVENQR